jgi:NAD(P)-dependent dehydrogenase (short-subunit alcohol dehydrogenase family)
MRALEDQVAVVTGASSGIGKAIALALANQGGYLFLLGRNLETLQSVADAAKGKAPQSQCYQTDLAIESEVQEVVLNIKRDTKSVDILVHSAGVIWLDAIENAHADRLDSHYKTNLRAPYVKIPIPGSPVRVSFIVHSPVPCPECKTETGKECSQCQGMGMSQRRRSRAPPVNHEMMPHSQ